MHAPLTYTGQIKGRIERMIWVKIISPRETDTYLTLEGIVDLLPTQCIYAGIWRLPCEGIIVENLLDLSLLVT